MARLDSARRKVFGMLLSWTQKYVPLREDALAEVGLAWPLIRRMLFELGRRLVAAGAIEKPDDVFWLEGDELGDAAQALDAGRAIWRTSQVSPRSTGRSGAHAGCLRLRLCYRRGRRSLGLTGRGGCRPGRRNRQGIPSRVSAPARAGSRRGPACCAGPRISARCSRGRC